MAPSVSSATSAVRTFGSLILQDLNDNNESDTRKWHHSKQYLLLQMRAETMQIEAATDADTLRKHAVHAGVILTQLAYQYGEL